MLPAEVSHALASLRCLPCLVGSYATTEAARREAVQRPLGLIEDLLAVCSTPSSAATKRASSAIEGGEVNTRADGGSERNRQRNEVSVLRAYALEAGVGLLCLLPAGDQGGKAERAEILERLLRWHDR